MAESELQLTSLCEIELWSSVYAKAIGVLIEFDLSKFTAEQSRSVVFTPSQAAAKAADNAVQALRDRCRVNRSAAA